MTKIDAIIKYWKLRKERDILKEAVKANKLIPFPAELGERYGDVCEKFGKHKALMTQMGLMWEVLTYERTDLSQ